MIGRKERMQMDVGAVREPPLGGNHSAKNRREGER
jgi:hypothetical protein